MRLFNLTHHLHAHRLKDHEVLADILSWTDSSPAHQCCPYVADNVPIEIGHDHDVKLVGIRNHLTQKVEKVVKRQPLLNIVLVSFY